VLYEEDVGSSYQGQETMLSKHFVEQTAGGGVAEGGGYGSCFAGRLVAICPTHDRHLPL
jgi:hypothetical protein